MAVPLLDLHAQYAPIRAEVIGALTRVADSQQFILGAEVEAFERELAARVEVDHAIGVSSGTDALLAVLMALGVGPGAEVITPTYSFFATAGCIARLGATPVFVDIDAATFNVTAAAVERALTSATRAIMVVHLFGLSADMEGLRAVAARAGVPLIEDAAQAIGAKYRGRPVGGFGAAACFSFFPSKNLGAFGDAGMVTTNDAALAREVRLLRNHGMDPKYFHARIGGNFRLDALQAAVLRVKAPHLSGWTDARRRNADRYRALVHECGLDRHLVLPVEPEGHMHIYNQFVVRSERRDELRAFLAARRVGTEVYYPVPFHRQACFAGRAREGDRFPVADAAAASSLALPIYGELTLEQQRHVVGCLADFAEARA
ncbi:MAG: DegT/DnrJ/EryC1/StrS family aminotransferase [Acidobacteria bacterium]|nr:DegT/DnrJ/EryC1/StrS family aminotransferase [Acidobacteriota bacterium]